MAVPIPRRGKRKQTTHERVNTDFALSYTGKQSIEAILATPPGQYTLASEGKACANRLYHADNLPVLAALAQDTTVAGHVRVVYIDPPFATAASFESRKQDYAYDDQLVGPEFVEALRARLVFIHRILAHDGSLYLHLDGRMAFRIKIILDEVFGEQNFRNCITRKKCNPKNYTRKTFGNVADYILFYTKTDDYVWNRPMEPWDNARALKEYQYTAADGRKYKKVPVHAPGARNGATGKEWRGKLPPPGKHWQYPPAVLDEMDARGEIYWSPTGNPRRKLYFESSEGVPLQDIWMDVRDAHNQNVKITGYPTEKNPVILTRAIEASSNLGDLVLDCYAGSGTTLAIADQCERRWIGVDRSDEAIKTILHRMKYGTGPMGDFVGRTTKPTTLPLFSSSAFVVFTEGKTKTPRRPNR